MKKNEKWKKVTMNDFKLCMLQFSLNLELVSCALNAYLLVFLEVFLNQKCLKYGNLIELLIELLIEIVD